MNNRVDSAFTTALQKTALKLTTAIRKDAIAAGWPIQYAAALYVKVVKAEIKVDYPSTLATAIEDLEYGTQDSPPQPVIRTFMTKHGDIISDAIAEASLDYALRDGMVL